MTVGSKFERNEFTGFEIQPTIRARWSAPHQSVWGAVSRAVRVPTRFDTDLRFRFPNSSALLLTGSPDFESENVIAYEAGYRRQFHERLSVDIATYVNRYDDLRTQEFGPGQPITLTNMMNALTRGVEIDASVQVLPLVAGARVACLLLEGAHVRSGQHRPDARHVRRQRPAATFSSCARTSTLPTASRSTRSSAS